MPERELQGLVAEMCAHLGLLHFHVHYAKHMRAGWPDSTIIGAGKVIFRELKSEFGRLTPEQRLVGERLKSAGQDWRVWRPSDWISGAIETELRLLKGQPQLPLEAS
jgi:hypothetical protein